MPLREALKSCFRCVDITERGAVRIVSVLCHVRNDGPRGGIQLCCLHEIKTCCTSHYFTCVEHLTSPVVVRFAVKSRGSNKISEGAKEGGEPNGIELAMTL